jgi:hypothetical protein
MAASADNVSQSLSDLVAKQAIAAALACHSRGIDRADFTLLSSAYHPGATVDYGFFVGAASDLATILASAQKTQPVTLHRTCNMWIQLDGTTARSESYVLAYLESPDATGAVQRLIGGRYLDRHEERAGEWRLTHRTYVMDWNTNRPSTGVSFDPPLGFVNFTPRGGHGCADPGNTMLAFAAAQFRRSGERMANKISDAQIDAAVSKQALHELGMAYARAADRADAQLMASLFHEDSTVIAGVANGNGAGFAVGVADFISKNLERSFHSVANEWFHVDGDDAIGESYVIAMVTAGGKDSMTGGRYADSYQRRNGVWKFKTRTFVMDWSTSHPTTHATDGMYGALKIQGRFGKDDPVYAFWNSRT